MDLNKFLTYSQDRTFVKKGWGWEDWICNSELYCGKRLFFQRGKKCSFHYHKLKDEVLFCESGRILLKFSENDDFEKAKEILLLPGMAFHVIPGMRHQMFAEEESMIFEVSTQHFETDSYRIIKGD